MASPVRRSSRARRQATTIYDIAAEQERERRLSRNEKLVREEDDDDEEGDSSESDSGDESDEDSAAKPPSPKRKRNTVSPTKTKKPPKGSSPAVVRRKPPKKTAPASKTAAKPRKGATVSSKNAFTKSRITQALKMLSKSVLNNHLGSPKSNDDDDDGASDPETKNHPPDVDETPENSLVAALLACARPKIPGIASTSRPKTYCYSQQEASGESSLRDQRRRAVVDLCLPQLDGILRHLVRTTDNSGPHVLHTRLLNLLFRSVGGSTRTNLKEGTDLDDLEDEDWDAIISRVVTVMKNESAADQTLLVVEDDRDDDEDRENGTQTLTTRQIGTFAYRTLFQEFWCRLGHVLLAHSPSPAAAMVSEDEEEDSDSETMAFDESDSESEAPQKAKKKPSKKKKPAPRESSTTQGFSSNRFQLEKVRDLILRMTELVSVGQPDLRAASTIAVLQLAKACVERTVELEQKIRVATRQLRVASKAGSKQKQQALQLHLDNWKRHKAELEEIVEGPVFQGVFIHRYRDTNERIRRDCLRTLSQISTIRPDIFLVDTYLKYFGWMASDKAACVRIAALEGLTAPFGVAAPVVPPSTSAGQTPFPIDARAMHNVTLKFLARIVDCTDDSQSLRVQELAMKLLLSMLREEFLDEWEDDTGWDKINLKALDALSSSGVRRDALYFVMDQLDAFDTDGKAASALGDKKQSEQLVAIARWCANKLCDGVIPIDKMNIELVDLIVESLLDMPEHKELVLNWPMILKAIRSENPQQGSANERQEIASQRSLLRMLATAARVELANASPDSENAAKAKTSSARKRRRSSDPETSLDQLSTALLKNLPHLLDAFKSDVMGLRDITKLPPTITSSVLGLPSRKTDFQNLVKTLCQLYLDSTDEQILENIAKTLSQWVEGDHTRVSEVKINVKRLSGVLQDRLMQLFRESDPLELESQKSKASSKRKRSKTRRSQSQTDGDSTVGSATMFSTSPEADAEHSISLLMTRWNILLSKCQAKYLFEKADGEEEDEMEGLYFTISEAMGKRLSDRMPTLDHDVKDDATAVTTPAIWKEQDPEVHEAVATTIKRALQVLLLIVSYELSSTLMDRKEIENSENSERLDEEMEIDEYNFPVLKMRDNLVKLLGLCFDQHLPEVEGVEYTNEQHEFAKSIQAGAGHVASDLRTLFPFNWSTATDPVRRALALSNGDDFTFLLSGFARWFQSVEDNLEDDEETDSTFLVKEALLPLARVTNMNFDGFFRKEAAMIMQHISGSGNLASQTVLSLSRVLKKTNPVRMLESQMACLRLAFENWLDTEPVVPEGTSPTEEEIQAFEEEERSHLDAFSSMELVAAKLSSTLGNFNRLANDSLKKSIFGFMREGIRYSFDGVGNQQDDDLVVGSRLAFLLILSKYSNWFKKEKDHLDQLSDFLIEKESDLRRHPEFEEVHEDDLNALAAFKKSLGIKRVVESSLINEDDPATADDRSSSVAATPSPSTGVSGASSRRLSALSKGSRTSRRSGMSVQSELSPLYEEDATENNDGDSDGSPTPQKRRRLDNSSISRADNSSIGSSITKSTFRPRRGTIPEEDESNSGKDSEE